MWEFVDHHQKVITILVGICTLVTVALTGINAIINKPMLQQMQIDELRKKSKEIDDKLEYRSNKYIPQIITSSNDIKSIKSDVKDLKKDSKRIEHKIDALLLRSH